MPPVPEAARFGEPVQIINATENHSFELNIEALEKILLGESIRNKKVCVVLVAGACRKGKSFLPQFLLRYLNKRGANGWIGNGDEPLSGFSWRGGSERETTGIWFWSKVFLCPGPDSEEMESHGDEQKLRSTKDEFQKRRSIHQCSDRLRWNTLSKSSFHSPLWSLFLITLCLITGVTSATFPIGTNITQTRIYELTSHYSHIDCIARIADMNEPFFYANHIDPRGLKPGQNGRFTIQVHQSGKNVTILWSISDIQPIDEGTYLISVFEEYGGSVLVKEYTVNIIVWYPPGKAECKVQTPYSPSYDWLMVSCSATVGSDSHGIIFCHQGSKRSPHFRPATFVGDQISAVFWLDPALPAVCCSASNDSVIDQNSCKDFEYSPPEGHDLSTDLVSSTSTMSTSMDSTLSPAATSQTNIDAVVTGFVAAIVTALVVLLIWAIFHKVYLKSWSFIGNGTTASQMNGRACSTPNSAREINAMIDTNGNANNAHNTADVPVCTV